MSKLSGRLEAHFATCAVAAAAFVGLGTTGSAGAAVVQSTVTNLLIPVSTAGIYVNVVANTTGASSSLTGWDINPWGTSNLSFFQNSSSAPSGYLTSAGSATLVDNLALGAVVAAGGTYISAASEAAGGAAPLFILNSSNNYVGFRFQSAELGAGTYYGYMQIKLGASFTDATRAIVGIWYENVAGTSITVVPAPGAVALLGLAGLVGKRRRR